jgi:hypothetical protein
LPKYLTHKSAIGLTDPYRDSAKLAVSKGKPMLMFETNTASCGGFVGISGKFLFYIHLVPIKSLPRCVHCCDLGY